MRRIDCLLTSFLLQYGVWNNTLFFDSDSLPNMLGIWNGTGGFELPAGGWSSGECMSGVCPVPFQFLTIAPMLGETAIFGEANKAVSFSSARFSVASLSKSMLEMTVKGSPSEIVDIVYFSFQNMVSQQVSCKIPNSSQATLICSAGNCVCI